MDVQLQDAWGDLLTGPASKRARSDQSASPLKAQDGKEKQKEKEKETGAKKKERPRSRGRRRRRLRCKTSFEAGASTTRTADGHLAFNKYGSPSQQGWDECSGDHVSSKSEMERVLGCRSTLSQRASSSGVVQDIDVFLAPATYRVVKRISFKCDIASCVERGQVLLRTTMGSRSRTIGHSPGRSHTSTRWFEHSSSRDCQDNLSPVAGACESSSSYGEVAGDGDVAVSSDLLGSYKRGDEAANGVALSVPHELLAVDLWEHERGEGQAPAVGGAAAQSDVQGLGIMTSALCAEQAEIDIFSLDSVPLHLRDCRLLRTGMMNEDNVCYANSLLACLTSAAHVHPPLKDSLPIVLTNILRVLLNAPGHPNERQQQPLPPPVHLVRDFPEVFQNWPLGAHEDAYEFMQHLLGSIHIPSMNHSVQVTRWNITGRMVMETQTQHVLTLGLASKEDEGEPAAMCLASLLENWGAVQEEEGEWHRSRCTLASAPHILVLHLQRFAFSQGMIRKLRPPVKFEDTIRITLGTGESMTYQIAAILAHHGEEVNVGHYSAYIHVGDGAGYFRCNDVRVSYAGQTATELPGDLASDAYMFFLKRA